MFRFWPRTNMKDRWGEMAAEIVTMPECFGCELIWFNITADKIFCQMLTYRSPNSRVYHSTQFFQPISNLCIADCAAMPGFKNAYLPGYKRLQRVNILVGKFSQKRSWCWPPPRYHAWGLRFCVKMYPSFTLFLEQEPPHHLGICVKVNTQIRNSMRTEV